jgi:hypothetical protein
MSTAAAFSEGRSAWAAVRRANDLEVALRDVLECCPPFDKCRNEGSRLFWWTSDEYASALRRAWRTLQGIDEGRPTPAIPKVQHGLGRALQRRRIELGLTIAEVARRARVDRHDWSRWERRGDLQLRPLTLARIAAGLGTTIEDLISGGIVPPA